MSRAIEEYARGQGRVTAIVVPWESDADDAQHGGHRGEERRLGHRAHQPGDHPPDRRGPRTGRDVRHRRRADPDHPEQQQLAALFDRFVRQVQSRFHVASLTSDRPDPDDHGASAPRRRRRPPIDAARRRGARRGHRPRHRAAGAGRSRAHRRPTRRRAEDHRPHWWPSRAPSCPTTRNGGHDPDRRHGPQQLRRGAAGTGVGDAASSTRTAVSVRLSPLWAGAAPAIIAPERMLEDLRRRAGRHRLRSSACRRSPRR